MTLAKLKKRQYILGLTVWYLLAWSWALQTDSLKLAGSKLQGLILAILTVTINVALSVYVVSLMLRFTKSLETKVPRKLLIPTFLLVFAFADFIVAWVPAILWLGPQGRLDSVLPLGSAAFVLIRTPLVFGARIIGFYGLAAFVWTTIYVLCRKNLRRLAYIPPALLIALSIIGWLAWRTPKGTNFNARIVSETLKQRLPAVIPSKEDLVIFPEYGLEKSSGGNLNYHKRITANTDPSKKTYFLGSEQIYKGGRIGHENRLLFGNTIDGYTNTQDKYRLIPGGEDLPYTLRTLLRATDQVKTLNYFSYAKGVLKGPHQLQPLVMGSSGIRVGAALCSSIIAPQDYRDFVREGANVLTNSASLTTFKGSTVFAWEQQSMGRFMAVANSRYFLQSANSASAYAYDNNGKKLGQVRDIQSLDLSVSTNNQKTLYDDIGEVMVWLGGVIVAYGVIRPLVQRKAKTPKSKSKVPHPH